MQEAPAQGGGGGGVAEAFVQTDAMLAKLAKIVTSADQIPDEAKQAITTSLESLRACTEIVMQAAKGAGGQQPAPGPQGAVAPEAGASGAVPESMAGVRR